jgi:hypothetical protein
MATGRVHITQLESHGSLAALPSVLPLTVCRTKKGLVESLAKDAGLTEQLHTRIGGTPHHVHVSRACAQCPIASAWAHQRLSQGPPSAPPISSLLTPLFVCLLCCVASGVVQGGMRLKGISGGEKRRLALVACAITSPAIMFLDGKTTSPHSTTLSHLAHPISPCGQSRSFSLLQSRRVGWTRTRPFASWSMPRTGPLAGASCSQRFTSPAARSGSYSTRYGPTLDSNRSTEKTYTELSLYLRAPFLYVW